MERFETALRRAILTLDLALGLVLAGIGDLAINAWMVYLGHPGLSLVAAYQRGREPWTSLGIGAVIAGASAAIVIGAALALAQGSWIRRLLALGVLALGAAWWLTALSVLPWAGLSAPDPIGFAFVHVREVVLGLLLPAVAAALLVFTPRRERPTSRMAPVHPDEWH